MCNSLYLVALHIKLFIKLVSARCFALIESSTLEQTREETETEKMTHLESLVELGLSSTFSTILTQCSIEIFKVCSTLNEHLLSQWSLAMFKLYVYRHSYFPCNYMEL